MALVICDMSISIDGYVTGGWGDSCPVGDVPCFVVTHTMPVHHHIWG